MQLQLQSAKQQQPPPQSAPPALQQQYKAHKRFMLGSYRTAPHKARHMPGMHTVQQVQLAGNQAPQKDKGVSLRHKHVCPHTEVPFLTAKSLPLENGPPWQWESGEG